MIAAAASAQFRRSNEEKLMRFATLAAAMLVEALSIDVSPPLYYFLLSGWMRMFGDSEVAVRSLSVLFYLAGIGVAWRLGRMLLGPEGAWLTSFLYAVSPVAGRQYSFATARADRMPPIAT